MRPLFFLCATYTPFHFFSACTCHSLFFAVINCYFCFSPVIYWSRGRKQQQQKTCILTSGRFFFCVYLYCFSTFAVGLLAHMRLGFPFFFLVHFEYIPCSHLYIYSTLHVALKRTIPQTLRFFFFWYFSIYICIYIDRYIHIYIYTCTYKNDETIHK